MSCFGVTFRRQLLCPSYCLLNRNIERDRQLKKPATLLAENEDYSVIN
jgi:hypothetical protein